VRLYRVPRASESGYALKERPSAAGQATTTEACALTPVALPFGGHGLDRVRDRLGRLAPGQVLTPAMDQARDLLGRTPGMVERVFAELVRGYAWWRAEIRRSRAVQYGTAAVVIGLIVLFVWLYNRKPSTPWQRFRRDFGF
jgi:hypothetical protein